VRFATPNVAEVLELSAAPMTKQAFVLTELVEGASLRRLLDRAGTAHSPGAAGISRSSSGSKSPKGLNGARIAKGSTGAPSGLPTSTSPRATCSSRGSAASSSPDFGVGTARQVASSVRSLSHVARRADTMAPEVAAAAGR